MFDIKEAEDQTFLQDDSPEVPPQDIVAYNELRSCADLFRMYTQEILDIQPDFQREIVWKPAEQTRFIDSLIKQLPIPSMCFSLDFKLQKWQVIDGLQRMASIIRFLSGRDWILSKLEDIDPKIAGQPISKFIDQNSELHNYYSRVENLTLPITVLRCDYSKKSHTNYLFTIFHRLNAGGMKLNNQEIRNCIYGGTFNQLLNQLNSNMAWMKINRMKSETGYRFTKQELILRFFALHDEHKSYNGRLSKFLNEYMSDNRNPQESFLNEKKKLFERTVNVILKKLFEGKVTPKITVTILEALLVGISENLNQLEAENNTIIKRKYHDLQMHEEFSDQKLSEGLSGKMRVINRLDAAISIFRG
jgi:hypothetical protein